MCESRVFVCVWGGGRSKGGKGGRGGGREGGREGGRGMENESAREIMWQGWVWQWENERRGVTNREEERER